MSCSLGRITPMLRETLRQIPPHPSHAMAHSSKKYAIVLHCKPDNCARWHLQEECMNYLTTILLRLLLAKAMPCKQLDNVT